MSAQIAPWLAGSRWPTAPVRYVAKLGTGHTPSRQHPEYWENCTVPWITLADVWQLREGRVNVVTETSEKISARGLANSAAVKHPAGTVILSRTASVGLSAIMGTDMATSQDFATWTCGESLDPRYLLYSLRAMVPDLRRLTEGSTHKTIYMPDIAQLRIPLPWREEQSRIADFLDAEIARMKVLSSARIQQDHLLTEHLQSSLSSTADELFRRWGGSRLRHVLIAMEQGWSPECEDRPAAEGEWGVVKAGCVNHGVFQPDQHKALPSHVMPRLEYELNSGDLLMSRASGSIDLIGSVGIVTPLTRRLLLCDKVYRLRLDVTKTKAPFIAHMLRTRAVRDQIKLGISGASGLANNLPSSVVKDLVIPVPPLDIQEKTIDGVQRALDRIGDVRAVLNSQLDLLAERRQALITAAVTGQMDVTTARGVGRDA